MLAGFDQTCGRSRVHGSILSINSSTNESPQQADASGIRNSPLIAGLSFMSKNPPHTGHKPIVQSISPNRNLMSYSPNFLPMLNCAQAQSNLPSQDCTLINRILPKIGENTHESIQSMTPYLTNYSIPKSSSSSTEEMLTPVDLEKYVKNPVSVPHSRVLRRLCPPGSAIVAPQTKRKSVDNRAQGASQQVKEPSASHDRQFKSANAFIDSSQRTSNFSISDDDLDDTEIYQDIATSIPNSRNGTVARARPVLQADPTSTHKRPIRRLKLGHAAQLAFQSVSKSSVLPTEKAYKLSDSFSRRSIEAVNRNSPITDSLKHTSSRVPFSASSETIQSSTEHEACRPSDALSPRLSSQSSRNKSQSLQSHLGQGQSPHERSAENHECSTSSADMYMRGHCLSADDDLPKQLYATLTTINEADSALQNTREQLSGTDDQFAASSICGPSNSMVHILTINTSLDNDCMNEQNTTLLNSDSFTSVAFRKKQRSTDQLASLDVTQLSNASFVHNSNITDEQDQSGLVFISSKRSVIHLLKTGTKQVSDQKILTELDQTNPLFMDTIDDNADSYAFFGKNGEDENSFGVQSCIITPRCFGKASQCNKEKTDKTLRADKQDRPNLQLNSNELIKDLTSDDWKKQVSAITKCIDYFKLPLSSIDRIEVQALIEAYISTFSSPRSKVSKHAIETLVPIFLTKNPTLLLFAEKIFVPLLLCVGSTSQSDFISVMGDQALHVIATLARPGKLMPHLQREAQNKSPGVRWRVAQLFTIIFNSFSNTPQLVSFFRSYTEIYAEVILKLIGDSSELTRKHAREAFTLLWNMTRIPGESTSDFLCRYKLYTPDNLTKLKFLS